MVVNVHSLPGNKEQRSPNRYVHEKPMDSGLPLPFDPPWASPFV